MALVSTTIAIFSTGCGDDPPYTRQRWVNTYIYEQIYAGLRPIDDWGITIDCEAPGTTCADAIIFWYQYFGEDINVVRQAMDTLHYYYYRNDMSTFYARYDLDYLYPEVESERPGFLDSLEAGFFKLVILGDSTLAVIKPPLDSIGLRNLEYVALRYPGDYPGNFD